MLTEKTLGIRSFLGASIALFPFVEKPIFDLEKILPPEVLKEKVIGVADLEPIVVNRLYYFNKYGKTFAPKNLPVTFSVFDNTDSAEVSVTEYWDKLMRTAQKSPYPLIWAMAPQIVCEFIIDEYIQGAGKFYYHNPSQERDRHYYAITNSGGIIRAHLLFSEA